MRNRTYSHSTGFDNHMGVLVKKATDSSLSSPNWVLNMSICDMCRGSPSNCENVTIACIWRLKESNEIVILLTLTLLDLCMKFAENTFPGSVNKMLLDEMVYIVIAASKGHRAEELAKRMIKEWAIRQKDYRSVNANRYPIFHDTYANLVAKGASFPFTIPQNSAVLSSSPGLSSASSPSLENSPLRNANSGSFRTNSGGFRTNSYNKNADINSASSFSSTGSFNNISNGQGNAHMEPFESVPNDIFALCSTSNYHLLKLESDLLTVENKLNMSQKLRKQAIDPNTTLEKKNDILETLFDIYCYLDSCKACVQNIIIKGSYTAILSRHGVPQYETAVDSPSTRKGSVTYNKQNDDSISSSDHSKKIISSGGSLLPETLLAQCIRVLEALIMECNIYEGNGEVASVEIPNEVSDSGAILDVKPRVRELGVDATATFSHSVFDDDDEDSESIANDPPSVSIK